jgi:hypothetical protein
MRMVLGLLFSPCVICLGMIFAAFAVDDYGTPGRVAGTAMIAAALWGPEVLIAKGWLTGCATQGACVPPAPEGSPAPPGNGTAPAWWKRRYTLKPYQVVLLCGLGGVAVGVIASLSLDGPRPGPLVSWGLAYGVMGLMVGSTIRLLDKAHPHSAVFSGVVRHASRLGFVALFALGLWQRLPAGLVAVLSGGMCALILFTLGTVWSLALLVQAAAKSLVSSPGWTQGECCPGGAERA